MKDLVHQQAVIPHILHPTRFAFAFVMRLLFVLIIGSYIRPVFADGVPFHPGDIVITLASGSGYTWDNRVKHFSPNGVLLDTFEFGVSNNYLVGPGFDSSNNLYIPYHDSVNTVFKINNDGTRAGTFGSGYATPWSILFDNSGNAYVGEDPVLANGIAPILKFDANGNSLATYSAQSDPTSGFGVDYFDLAADQCTLRYTSQGESIKQFNVCTNTQLPDLVTSLPDSGASPPYELIYAIRGLSNGNLLVGTWDDVFLLDSSGAIIQKYNISGSSLGSIALDPDKQTFWAGDWSTGNIYRFNIQTGAVVFQFNAGGANSLAVVPAQQSAYDPVKNLGKQCPCVGDPINAATGNEYRDDEDISLGALSFHRYYNSQSAVAPSHIGMNWRDSFDRSVEYLAGSNGATATVLRPDGRQFHFVLTSGQWVADADVADRLVGQTDASGAVTGWNYFDAATRYQESYDPNGNLLSITDTNGQATTMAYSTASTPTSIAPSAGLLLTVTDPLGRVLSFTYNGNSEVATVKEPDGGVLTYGYNANANLTSVTYPDTTSRQYVYNESTLTGGANLPNALTGDIDESGGRFTSIGYNSQGKATMSALPGGVDLTQVVYNSGSTTSVTYPTSAQATLSFVAPHGSAHPSAISAPCGPSCGQPNAAATFDSNGYLASTTDFNGNVTAMTHDANGLLDQQIDGSGSTEQRTTNTTWDTTLRVPLTRTVLDAGGNTVAKASWVYNTIGQPLARCEIDPTVAAAASYACAATGTVPAGVRRWTYTYCTAVDGSQCPVIGLLLSVKGPRTDLTQTTTYSYYLTSSATGCGTPGSACYQAGDLYRIKDALGHNTTYASYDAAGRVTRITDANGVHTDMTYTSRGWLATRIVGGATTTFGYDAMGDVTTIKDPSGVTTTFTYDAAHRLTDITDAQGNVIHYTLDAAGNKTSEQTRTASGTVVRSLSRRYNALGQVTAIIDGLSHTVFNGGYSDSYDANGHLVHSADALGFQHQQSFDALNRLNSTIANYNGTDPATQNTQTAFDYDALDRLDGVADPSGLNTLYTYDGLSNRTQLQSPDTGTSTDTYDAAGNRLTHTDANGIISTSTYDALNRRRTISYADTTLNVTYAYDEANTVTGCTSSRPKGRLTRVVEGSVITAFCYDGRGNVIQKRQVTPSQTDITKYTYTAADRLSTVIAPDNTLTTYVHNSDGLISSVRVTPSGATSASPTVVSAITWLPFGPISSYKLGNGQTVKRSYDANYRLTDLTSPALTLHFARDAMGNIMALGNAPGAIPATETYSYDPLYRLTGISDTGTALESYTYNPTGDRLSKTAPGLATGAYLYTTGTHQLASIGSASRANDANGNTTGSVIGGETFGFGYNARNRLTLAQRNGQTVGTYTYNALGQRIGKVASFQQAVTERYAYNEAGQLIGEYGTSNRDYVWLGDLPVAVIDNTINGSVTTSTVNYVTADQLGTPRAITDGTGTVIWSWAYQGNPFGEQQPTSSTGYMLNLRYPGQYYDAESGTNYNMFRTYEPATGRYLQSDPIGLAGGISTYAYVGGNPLSNVDPLGLQEVNEAEMSPAERDALRDAFAPLEGPNQLLSLTPATEQEQELAEGECPAKPRSWSAARRAFWQNEAMNHPYDYSPDDLNRMERGLPPLHPELGVPKELHHIVPQRDGGSHDPSNLAPLWPWEHAEVDPYRYYNGPVPSNGGVK